MAADELHDLLGGGVPRVHFNGRQLDVLNVKACTEHCVSASNSSSVLFKTIRVTHSLSMDEILI